MPGPRRSRPSPHWNRYRITCFDGAISLEVDGREVLVLDLPGVVFEGSIGIEAVAGKVTLANPYARPLR